MERTLVRGRLRRPATEGNGWAMRKPLWICPRCAAKNRPRTWKCRRCRVKVPLDRRLPKALLWAGALR